MRVFDDFGQKTVCFGNGSVPSHNQPLGYRLVRMKNSKQTDRIATTMVPHGRYRAGSNCSRGWIERSPPLANTPGLAAVGFAR